MAYRLYFNRESAPISPTLNGAWDATTVTRGLLSPQKGALAPTTIQQAETSTDPAWDVVLTQHVSAPLTTAQTISGTFDLCRPALETNAAADLVWHIHVWVTQGDTSTPRGVLLADYIDATEFPTSEAGLSIAQQTLSPVAAQVGDRIVVECGFRALNSVATSYSGRVRNGGNGADIANGGTAVSTDPGWCEFGTDILDAEARIDAPTKLYLGGVTEDATAIPPLVRGAWTSAVSVTVASADQLLPATPAVASTTVGLSTGATTADLTRLLKIFVSPPLNAGTLAAGTARITGLTLEQHADQDVVWCLHLYLMARNGDVRATILNLAADPDNDNEWPITTAAGRQSDAFAVAETVIEQDDRLVLEVGGKQLGTPASAGSITIRQGGTGADAGVGDTDTTRPTWLSLPGLVVVSARRPNPVWVGL